MSSISSAIFVTPFNSLCPLVILPTWASDSYRPAPSVTQAGLCDCPLRVRSRRSNFYLLVCTPVKRNDRGEHAVAVARALMRRRVVDDKPAGAAWMPSRFRQHTAMAWMPAVEQRRNRCRRRCRKALLWLTDLAGATRRAPEGVALRPLFYSGHPVPLPFGPAALFAQLLRRGGDYSVSHAEKRGSPAACRRNGLARIGHHQEMLYCIPVMPGWQRAHD